MPKDEAIFNVPRESATKKPKKNTFGRRQLRTSLGKAAKNAAKQRPKTTQPPQKRKAFKSTGFIWRV
jgi:hypothetical protein